jgi:hypothetical protein
MFTRHLQEKKKQFERVGFLKLREGNMTIKYTLQLIVGILGGAILVLVFVISLPTVIFVCGSLSNSMERAISGKCSAGFNAGYYYDTNFNSKWFCDDLAEKQ